jgi:hypothetical protein
MKSTHLNIAIILIILFNLFGIGVPLPSGSIMDEELGTEAGDRSLLTAQNADHHLYLPILISPPRHSPCINLPYFEHHIRYPETAIFWFGKVTSSENYADVRLGYSDQELFVHLTVFDRRLWYDPSPTVGTLTEWDAASLYLNLPGSQGGAPSTEAYRFVAQLNWWESRHDWQAAYRDDGQGWAIADIPFTSTSSWRGTAPNNDNDDRGWTMAFRIPFASLGLSAAPQMGSVWGLALTLHDRDDAAGTPISDKLWPSGMDPQQPRTWAQLHFGLPAYIPPSLEPSGTVTIRHGLDGVQVVDGHVGGDTTCGQPYWPNFFDGWGDANYTGYEQVNVQNQSDVADWPCFSKFYLTFPLDRIPAGKEILSATLRLHLFGNSGQGWDPPPQSSLIQVLTVLEAWDENTLTWNNAPLAYENVARTWVYPVDEFPGWPGVPYNFELSRAVAAANANGEPLRLVLYSADAAIHSGKYFISSDTGEWNAQGRPTLEVVWGQP